MFRLEFERKRAIKAERDRVRDDENSVKAEKAKQKEVSYIISERRDYSSKNLTILNILSYNDLNLF